MADVKISQLPAATTPLTGAELVPVVQGGTTKKTTTSDVLAVPITSLTASSAVATDANKKLVSVANTGTGDNVLSTSPTLVTPILGTPTSATLTNAIGLPIATGVSGLGTGVATFLATPSSANLAAALTDETGSGLAVFATSPTLVTPALGTPSALVGTNITGTAAGLTAGNVTTNANLTGAVTSVGNATSLGSFSSANLAGALTDETGSGSAVFATSPTLVTPILGTPQSVTLTNGTGLPISTGVSGLGTGVATALGVNVGTAGSPVVNGGALGTPSSGTVTNLTGTANITVTGGASGAIAATTLSASSTVTLSGGTATGVAYLDGSKVLTTGSALTFDGTLLTNTVADAVTSNKWAGASGKVRLRPYVDATLGALYEAVNAAENAYIPLSLYASQIRLQGDSAIVGLIGGSEQMRLTATGLGIGTSSPAQKLSVYYPFNTEPTLTSNAFAPVSFNNAGIELTYGASASSPFAAWLQTKSGGASWDLAINPLGGNVGIGTSSPGAKLDVAGAVRIVETGSPSGNAALQISVNGVNARTIRMTDTASSGKTFDFINRAQGIAGNFGFFDDTAGAYRYIIDASGNLGLGVTPSAWGASSTALQNRNASFWATSAAAYIGYNYFYDGSVRKYIASSFATEYTQLNGQHLWYNAASGTAGNTFTFTQAMTLDASGNLLVGTTALDTSNLSGFIAQKYAGGVFTDLGHNTSANSGDAFSLYRYNGSIIGSITQNGTTGVLYNTSSDYRLKDITGPITTSGAYIDSLNPVEGTWKADGRTFVGLLAHEVQEASRTTVATGTKDGDQMQGMDYSSAEIIANLIAEMKSLRQRLQIAGI